MVSDWVARPLPVSRPPPQPWRLHSHSIVQAAAAVPNNMSSVAHTRVQFHTLWVHIMETRPILVRHCSCIECAFCARLWVPVTDKARGCRKSSSLNSEEFPIFTCRVINCGKLNKWRVCRDTYRAKMINDITCQMRDFPGDKSKQIVTFGTCPTLWQITVPI